MSKLLGILIPQAALEDEVIFQFCKPYIEDGIFQELILEKKTSPRKKAKPSVFFTDDPAASIATKFGLDESYVKWAKAWYSLFVNARGKTKVLENADVIDWVTTVRLMLEKENRDLVKAWQYFKYMETLAKDDKERFWFNIVDSISGIRKHWDKISANFWKIGKKDDGGNKTAAGL